MGERNRTVRIASLAWMGLGAVLLGGAALSVGGDASSSDADAPPSTTIAVGGTTVEDNTIEDPTAEGEATGADAGTETPNSDDSSSDAEVSSESDADLTEPDPTEEMRTDPHVVGNQLRWPGEKTTRLVGVNRSGGEYACVQRLGFWDGPADEGLIDAIEQWGVNTIRLPLNEHCWLGLDTSNPYTGQAYRDEVERFVSSVAARDMITILDLHWSGPGTEPAVRNMPMPNADHSEDFWVSVAATFAEEPLVLFDVFNEPHDVDWECWRDGCEMAEGYTAVGMQDLIDAIRRTGAFQPIIVSGLAYANDLDGWLAASLEDPVDALVAGFHVYNFNVCRSAECWDRTVRPVADVVPVVAAEIGEDSCSGDFTTTFLEWAAEVNISIVGWTFNPWDCGQGPALVTDHAGTPTPFGEAFRDHVLDTGG